MSGAEAPGIDIIVAMAENGVIGCEGGMPWHLPSDLRHFKALTLGRVLVMGRRTFLSIGRPLKGRTTLVVSRDPAFAAQGVRVFADLEAALVEGRRLAAAAGRGGLVVAGGGAIYAATIGQADRLFVTRVHARPAGDTRFPAIDPALWRLESSEPMARGAGDSADMSFEIWERIAGAG